MLPLGVAVFFLQPAALLAKRAPPALSVSADKGRVPFKVKITGPAMLLEKARSCQKGWGGFGFSVQWGDGAIAKPAEGACLEELEHTYTVPGKYTVTADVFHPGPTDAPIFDFRGSKTVEASEGSKDRAVKVSLLQRDGKSDYYWGAGLPQLPFRLETGREVEVTAEVVKARVGTVLATETRKLAFTGDDKIHWSKWLNGPGGEHFDSDGRIDAYFRIRASAEGKVLSEDKSEPIRLHARVNFRDFKVEPETGKAPLEVKISTSISHSGCYSYIVNWGDGSAEDARGRPADAGASCRLSGENFELKHTYNKKGTYKIRWHDNNSNPFEPAAKGPGYMEKRVIVK